MASQKLMTCISETFWATTKSGVRAFSTKTSITNRTSKSKSTCNYKKKEDLVVPKEEVVRFIKDCLMKVGATCQDAVVVADHLMTADYRGHFSHGLNRLQMYVAEIENKLTNPNAQPEIINDCKAIALVDGKNGLGQVVGKFCMELAIKKCESYNIGMVSARCSNHYGICGYYSMMAMQKGMIGFTCTNTSPLMVPTRSKQSILGTNPLSLGMSTGDGDEFVLDMATTAVALGKIELADRKGEKIPEGWAMNKKGEITTDPKEALETHMMLPLGGLEMNSSYKGYGLAVAVEILCGILSGSNFGSGIRTWNKDNKVANLGHCFMAINPDAFAPGSRDRLTALLKQLRCAPTVCDKKVLVAGDPERISMGKVDKEGGIRYHENQIKSLERFACNMGIEPMKQQPAKEQCSNE